TTSRASTRARSHRELEPQSPDRSRPCRMLACALAPRAPMADSFHRPPRTPLAALTPPRFAEQEHQAAVARAPSHLAPREGTLGPRERPGLLDDVRMVLRTAHYSRRTEAT